MDSHELVLIVQRHAGQKLFHLFGQIKSVNAWAVAMAQMVERSVSMSETHGSNLTIRKFLILLKWIYLPFVHSVKDENKPKTARDWFSIKNHPYFPNMFVFGTNIRSLVNLSSSLWAVFPQSSFEIIHQSCTSIQCLKIPSFLTTPSSHQGSNN